MYMSPPHVIYFEASHWPSDHMMSSVPLIKSGWLLLFPKFWKAKKVYLLPQNRGWTGWEKKYEPNISNHLELAHGPFVTDSPYGNSTSWNIHLIKHPLFKNKFVKVWQHQILTD